MRPADFCPTNTFYDNRRNINEAEANCFSRLALDGDG